MSNALLKSKATTITYGFVISAWVTTCRRATIAAVVEPPVGYDGHRLVPHDERKEVFSREVSRDQCPISRPISQGPDLQRILCETYDSAALTPVSYTHLTLPTNREV